MISSLADSYRPSLPSYWMRSISTWGEYAFTSSGRSLYRMTPGASDPAGISSAHTTPVPSFAGTAPVPASIALESIRTRNRAERLVSTPSVPAALRRAGRPVVSMCSLLYLNPILSRPFCLRQPVHGPPVVLHGLPEFQSRNIPGRLFGCQAALLLQVFISGNGP